MPILARGESRGPMQKGITYMVRPFMQPLKKPFSLAFISTGSAQWLVGPASSSFSLQMNVRSSTRATSEGVERARKHPGRFSGFNLIKVPFSTIMLQSSSFSS